MLVNPIGKKSVLQFPPSIFQSIFECSVFTSLIRKFLMSFVFSDFVLDFTRCWRILRDVLEGLVCLHRKGLAHGNLEAGNVLLDEKGRAKLADFGNVQKVRNF